VVLDATDANSALWTTEVKVNGATKISPTALGFTPTINYVGIGSGGAGGTISNFSLTVVPEPSTYALVLGGIATLLLIRRRVQA
jgi:hypothetical protein